MIKVDKKILAEGKDVLKEGVKLFNDTYCIFVKCGQIITKYGSDRNITSFVIPPKESHKGIFFPTNHWQKSILI